MIGRTAVATDTPAAVAPWCRVLIVDHGLGLWGAQVYLQRLAPLLDARGVEQILAAPAGSGLAREWRAAGRRHEVIDVAPDRALYGRGGPAIRLAREGGRMLAGAWRIARLARRVDADVLHANSHGWAYPEVIAAAALSRRRAVVHLHLRLEPTPLGRLWARAIGRADATVGVSRAVTRTLTDPGAGAVHVVRPGLDPTVFAPGRPDPRIRAELSADPAAPLVLVLARLDPRKGIADVIRAIAALPPHLSGTRLAVAGGSTDTPDLAYEASLRALGGELLGDRVRFLGVRTGVPDLIRAADVVALASESEGLGLCMLEAQACGRPAVAYPAGGVAEVIEHGVDGLLARQADVSDLSAQLARVLDDPAYAARLGAAARERVLREGTLEQQAEAQVALLRTLARGRVTGR